MMIGNNSTIRLAYNSYNATTQALEKTARALSTGLKASTAADDAAGFAMGQNMSAQIAGLDRAIRNSQDGISLLQTAETALNQINSMLQRMRELSVQSANDTLTTQDRGYLQLEIAELRENINNVASNTTFNNKRLLDGSSTASWSSDELTTRLKVTGAITAIDQFGQKKNTEGNYRIEIRADAGQGEVQKTNIFELTKAKEYLRTETVTDEDGNETQVTIKDVKIEEATLGDMQAFRNSSGGSMLASPQTITIRQGDGKTAQVILHESDTLRDVSRKINDAIANGLGQAQYTDSNDNFCTIASGTEGTSEAVRVEEEVTRTIYRREYEEGDEELGQLVLDDYGLPQEILPSDYGDYEGEELDLILASKTLDEKVTKATMLVRSAVAGSAGRLSFYADNEDIINALGLSTIQEAQDNVFTCSVYDAHSGKVIASNVAAEGNTLNGVIHPNASVEFDSMANVKASWDDRTKRYLLANETQAYTTTIHITDKSTAFQVGQSWGEDMYINIGDMRSEALGLEKIDVSTREKASASITLLDAAIHKVGSQRAKVGAYQNELEYNANSLTQTHLHMQEAESRLKDTDMATEYMEFVKLQILSNTGSSMLAQANQTSQSIMSVLNM